MTRFSIRFTWRFTLLSALALSAGAAAADELFSRDADEVVITGDELFSRIPNDSVFTSPGDSPAGPAFRPQLERGQRILSITQLRDVLRDAGLEPDEDENIATIKLQHARWTFSVKLGLTEERDQLVLLVDLADLEGKQSLASDRLLALLSANAQHRPAFFSYSEKRKRIELLLSLDNTEITPRLLREELRKLATIAESTASLWEVAGSSAVAAAPAPATTAAPQQQRVATTAPAQSASPTTAPQAAAAPPANLVGKWSASRSATEAFAMQLNADSSFVLVYVKDGKQSRSTGKFSVTSGQLILTTSDGGKFGGGVANITARSFEFAPSGKGATKLTFQRAT
jgi:hypothetical protein